MLDRSDTIEHRSYIEKSSNETDEFKYKCEFLVGKFAPNDFKIKLKANTLTIEALHETEQRNPHDYALENFYYDNDETYMNRGSYLGKETERFVREIRMPHFVDLDTLACYLETYEDFQNVLVVEGLVDKRSDMDRTFVEPEVSTDQTRSPVKNSQVYSINRNGKNDLNIEHNRNHLYQLPQQQQQHNHNNSSIQNVDSEDRVTSDTFLKYRFDLSDFDAKDIQITIRERSILNVSAVRTVVDSASGKPTTERFNHDIQLPEHVEIHNIKNCFDENDGILRIEIPLKTDLNVNSPRLKAKNPTTTTTTSQSNMSDSNSSRSREGSIKSASKSRRQQQQQQQQPQEDDKYLELVFDLYDFIFDRVDVKENIDKRGGNVSPKNKLLVVRAYKADDYVYRPYLRKYVLPEWVDCERMFVKQDKQIVDGELKNVLIVQIAIRD